MSTGGGTAELGAGANPPGKGDLKNRQSPWRGRRMGVLASLGAFTGAVLAALLTGAGVGGFTGGVEGVSSASTTLLAKIAAALPLGYAFGAGMVAAVNPCGFALLPSYLALYLGSDEGIPARRRVGPRLVRAASVSAAVTLSFVVLFGVAGLLLSVATSAIAAYFPWAGLVIGILLVLAGGTMLRGRALYSSVGERLADRLGGQARAGGLRGYLAYGLAYGTASLSCTLPIFLVVVGTASTVRGFVGAFLQFVLYALGMGLVLTVLTLGAAIFKSVAVAKTRPLGRYLQPASAVLLLLTGAFVIYYWLTLGGLLATLGWRNQ